MTYNRRSSIQKWAMLRRILVYGGAIFVLCVAQCSFFARLSFLTAVPDVVMGGVAAIALFDSQKTAMVCGIASGFLLDALGSSGISLMPVVFFVVAIAASELAKKLIPNFWTWLVVLAAVCFIKSLLLFGYVMVSFDGMSAAVLIKTMLLPEIAVTMICSLPLFFIVRPLSSFVDAKSRFKM